MKRFLIFFLQIFSSVLYCEAQVNASDFGRIVLNSFVPENLNIPLEAKSLLLNKLNQITTKNGLGGSQSNPRFILTCNVAVGTKDIIPGPPQMVAQNIDLNLYIGDAISNIVFASVTIPLKGVGTNENKSYIEAFKHLNPNNVEVVNFIEVGKNKILEYYSSQCELIIKQSESLVAQQKYDEAIYELALVPEVCESCYYRCLDSMTAIYQLKIDEEGTVLLLEAKKQWAAAQDSAAAQRVGELLVQINPKANCQVEVLELLNKIEDKLKKDATVRWQFKMRQYADMVAAQKEKIRIAEEQAIRNDAQREIQSARNYELDKLRINAVRAVAVEQARNQPKTITYNNFHTNNNFIIR